MNMELSHAVANGYGFSRIDRVLSFDEVKNFIRLEIFKIMDLPRCDWYHVTRQLHFYVKTHCQLSEQQFTYLFTTFTNTCFPPTLEERSEEDHEFEVEDIVSHIRDDQGDWFLVRWSGFEEETWEPAENLIQNASEIVQTFFGRSYQ